jgi:hypothetical protein
MSVYPTYVGRAVGVEATHVATTGHGGTTGGGGGGVGHWNG